jgi:hypothetical protein
VYDSFSFVCGISGQTGLSGLTFEVRGARQRVLLDRWVMPRLRNDRQRTVHRVSNRRIDKELGQFD